MLGIELMETKFDGLLSMVKEYNYCRYEGNTKSLIIIMIVAQDPVKNSILSLHLGICL